MIIDRQQLTELLMDKTGLDKDQVEGQLSELIKRIQTATEAGKNFEIEGFGTFSIEDEELQFKAENRLETEINNKYTGMKPIELIGAFKEPDGSEIPEMPEEKIEQEGVWAFDETAERETEQNIDDIDDIKETEEEPSEVEELIEPTASDEKAQEEFEELINQTEEKPASPQSAESFKITGESDEQPNPPADSIAETKHESEEQDPIGRVLVAVVVVLTIGVTGFLIYDTGILADDTSGSDTPATANESVEQAEVGAGNQDDSDQEASEGDSEPEESKEVLKPVADVEEQTKSDDEQQKTYGLRGDINSSVSSGYTIVVHSLRSREQAESRKQNLEEERFRTLINEANVQGTIYYRVGIGQFATIKAAQDAIDDIPERYKSDHFIKRIQ